MKIRFYYKETGYYADCDFDCYLDREGTVFVDNEKYVQGESNAVSLHSFLEERPDIGWRVVED